MTTSSITLDLTREEHKALNDAITYYLIITERPDDVVSLYGKWVRADVVRLKALHPESFPLEDK